MAKRRNSSDSSESGRREADDSSSSSDGGDEEWNHKAKAKKKRSGTTKKVKSEVKDEEREEGEVDDDEEDDYDDEMDEFNDGYDENLFGDEEDQKRLNQMSEKEREQELFNRSEKREVLRARFEIEQKLRRQKRAEKERLHRKAFSESTLRSNERRRDLEAKNVRKDALKGLKEQREKKKLKQQKLRASDIYSSSSSSDDEDDGAASGGRKPGSGSGSGSSSSSSSDDSDNDSGRRGRRNESDEDAKDDYVVTIQDLETVKISRTNVEKWIHAPFFATTVTNAFTKVGIGQKANHAIYRVCQIVEVTEGPQIYPIGNSRTNKLAKLRYGSEEKNFRWAYISNGAISPNEFTEWKERLEKDNMPLPDRRLIESKRRDIQVASNYSFNEQDIEAMLREKEKFSTTPKNFAMRKTQLMKMKELAEQEGKDEEVAKLQRELDELEEKAKELDYKRSRSIAPISYINERNRLRNIAEAEKAIIEETKEREKSSGDDPFRRRQCAPQLVAFKSKDKKAGVKTEPGVKLESVVKDESGVAKTEPGIKQELIENAAVAVTQAAKTPVPVKTEVKSERVASPDSDPSDLFSAHNFDIQIDFDLGQSSLPSYPAPASASHSSSSNGMGSDSKNSFTNRRSLNLEEYKKRMNLI